MRAPSKAGVSAELLIEAARTSTVNGNDVETMSELREASELDPENEEIMPLVYQCLVRMGARKRRHDIADERE